MEVLAEQRGRGPVDAGAPGLSHDQVGVPGLDGRDRAERRGDSRIGLAMGSGNLECHEHAAAARRDQFLSLLAQGRPDVARGPGQRPQRRYHRTGRQPHSRARGESALRSRRPGLNQHGLRWRGDHVQVVEHPLGDTGPSRVVLRLALGAIEMPGEQRAAHHHEPADDGDDPVPGAPARDPLGDRAAPPVAALPRSGPDCGRCAELHVGEPSGKLGLAGRR